LKEIVITGGAGFIGSNLAQRLVTNGHSVRIIDDLSTGRLANIDRLVQGGDVDLVRGSILDRSLLREAFKGADYIFHLAALPSVARSVKDPLSTNEVNIEGTLNVLIEARDANVGKVVTASSSSVYGDTPTLPKDESMRPNPRSPYAISKLAGEHYCHVFSELYGLATICLRYFNVFGPHQDPRSEYAAVIPRFISSVLNGEPPLMYGDGAQTRDFTFVQDVVDANLLAMESDVEGAFNISGGRQTSIEELAWMIINAMGSDVEPVKGPRRPGDILHSVADITAARDAFGYRPEHSLEDGLEVTIEWFSSIR
jgi:UDP-glucose 4-epimerase